MSNNHNLSFKKAPFILRISARLIDLLILILLYYIVEDIVIDKSEHSLYEKIQISKKLNMHEIGVDQMHKKIEGYLYLCYVFLYYPFFSIGRKLLGIKFLYSNDLSPVKRYSSRLVLRSLFQSGPLILIWIFIIQTDGFSDSTQFASTILGIFNLCLLFAFLSCISALWSKNGQTWHDRFANVIAIKIKTNFLEDMNSELNRMNDSF